MAARWLTVFVGIWLVGAGVLVGWNLVFQRSREQFIRDCAFVDGMIKGQRDARKAELARTRTAHEEAQIQNHHREEDRQGPLMLEAMGGNPYFLWIVPRSIIGGMGMIGLLLVALRLIYHRPRGHTAPGRPR